MSKTFIILIDGPMGSGKTTLSKLLSQKLPDFARIALPDIKRFVPNFRENEATLKIIRDVILSMANTYLQNGVSIIVEQISSSKDLINLKELSTRHNSSLYAFRLTAPQDLRLKRVLERSKESLGVIELSNSKILEIEEYFKANEMFYHENPLIEATIIDSEINNPDEISKKIIEELE